MPRRKKLPAMPNYTDIGRNPTGLTVQKSNPLQTLSETSMTLPEFKILDAYLSRINSHDEEARFVRFEKGKLEEILGVSRIPKDELEKRLQNLFQVVRIEDSSKKRGFKLISLFEEAKCEQDDNGLWQIDLACTPSAMEYIFNIDNIGYLRYRLANVIDLTSRYSYILYLYLERNRFRRQWEVSVDELKKILNCTGESYNAFKVFNDRVLKMCYKELTKKTDLNYTYEPQKKGRRVTSIKFTVKTISNLIKNGDVDDVHAQIPGQLTMDDSISEYGSTLQLYSSACNNEFSAAEMEIIAALLAAMTGLEHPDGIAIARYHYLAKKYKLLCLAAEKRPIRHRFEYLKKMFENDKN